MITFMMWWFVVGYAPTAGAAVLAIAALRGDHGYQARHKARGWRRTAPSTSNLHHRFVYVATPEVRAARVRVEQRAEEIEARAARWNDSRTDTELAQAWLGITDVEPVAELHRHDPAAGSPAYLAVGSAPVLARDERITTAEMTLRFGHALAETVGPQAESDEWVIPDEQGPDDRAPGRHARGREKASVT